jgi:hypothetical protein
MEMNKKIIEDQRKSYGEAFLKHGATPQGTYQNNIETQYLRFERLIYNLKNELQNASIHDIGPGTCDFHKFLLNNQISHKYSGTEIVQEMIDYSLNEYEGIELYNRDFLQIEEEQYDFIFLSGTLNLKLDMSYEAWYKWSVEIIQKMFNHAKKAIAFNCLTSYHTFSQADLMYFKPQDIIDFCQKNLSRFSILDNAYPLYEFTVTVFKSDFIKEKYDQQSFKKYFNPKST